MEHVFAGAPNLQRHKLVADSSCVKLIQAYTKAGWTGRCSSDQTFSKICGMTTPAVDEETLLSRSRGQALEDIKAQLTVDAVLVDKAEHQ